MYKPNPPTIQVILNMRIAEMYFSILFGMFWTHFRGTRFPVNKHEIFTSKDQNNDDYEQT